MMCRFWFFGLRERLARPWSGPDMAGPCGIKLDRANIHSEAYKNMYGFSWNDANGEDAKKTRNILKEWNMYFEASTYKCIFMVVDRGVTNTIEKTATNWLVLGFICLHRWFAYVSRVQSWWNCDMLIDPFLKQWILHCFYLPINIHSIHIPIIYCIDYVWMSPLTLSGRTRE